MTNYVLRRLLLIIPTLFAIMVLNFVIVQFAPGGPVEQMIAKLQGMDSDVQSRISTTESSNFHMSSSQYSGSQGLDPDLIKEIEKMYGFDKPATERFWLMIKNYLRFDFGHSYFKNSSVIELMKQKLPVSISLGIWSTLLIYLLSIPLGIRKALKSGTRFDMWTTGVITIAYAIPSFLFAILLIVVFAGGNFFSWFPLRGLTSDDWETFTWGGKIVDYLWHITLPVLAMTISGFASVTLLTKNAFLEELSKQYVLTARSRGYAEKTILYKHVFQNALLILSSQLPSIIIHLFFSGSFLIEVIFSLDGLGLLSFEAVLNRDYPVVFGTLYIFTLISLVLHLFTDLLYAWLDPRIDFERKPS